MMINSYRMIHELNGHFAESSPAITVESGKGITSYIISLIVRDKRIEVKREMRDVLIMQTEKRAMARIMNRYFREDMAFLKQQVDKALSE